MSQMSPAQARMTDQGTTAEGTSVEGEPPDYGNVAGESLADRARRVHLGLWLAPVGILVIVGIVFWYYQSLGLDVNKNIQQASSLDWSTKLYPEIKQHLVIAFLSTLLVLVIAIPAGIALTRPPLRRYGPVLVAIANSGQALPAYGLLILFAALLGLGRNAVVVGLALYALLPVLRNTMVGLDAVDRA